MPITAKTNLFNGVNPHLNSYLQNTQGKWDGFHTFHLTDLVEYLDEVLPTNYSVNAEESLQIRTLLPFDFQAKPTRTVPDILIFGKSSGAQVLETATEPIGILELDEDQLFIEKPMMSVVVYQENTQGESFPVTRIELLSPANKSGGSHYWNYHKKKLETLKAGINVVEIDYLHQSPPVSPDLPSYPRGEPGSYPIWVLVSHPHPTYEKGKKTLYGSVINQELPKFLLPLAGDDKMIFDLNVAYNKTCLKTRMYREVIDYAQLPMAFDKYMPDDQERIHTRLKEIQDSHEIQPPS
jgi:hypothetical protein